MEEKFTTQNGTELTLQKLNRLSLQEILLRIGFHKAMLSQEVEAQSLGEFVAGLSRPEQMKVQEALNQLLNLCCMFGVSDSPPPYMADRLKALGFDTSDEFITRMYWLRHIVLVDDLDLSLFWPQVVAYSMKDEKPVEEAPEE